MKIDKGKYRLACARACMNTADVIKESGVKRSTLSTCMQRNGGSPATIGKIARALGCDVLDILADEEKEGK